MTPTWGEKVHLRRADGRLLCGRKWERYDIWTAPSLWRISERKTGKKTCKRCVQVYEATEGDVSWMPKEREIMLSIALEISVRDPGKTRAYYLNAAKKIQGDWRGLGQLFGYPPCCIDQFVEECENGIRPAKARMKETGGKRWKTPHVPCSVCLRETTLVKVSA